MSKMTAPLSIEPGTLPLSSLNDDPRDIMIIKQTDMLVGIKWNSSSRSRLGGGAEARSSASASAIATVPVRGTAYAYRARANNGAAPWP